MTADSASANTYTSLGRRLVFGRNPKRTFIRIAVLVVTVTVLRAFVFLPIDTNGPSMEPTYRDGINIVNQLAYVFHPPQRGDVVGIRVAETGHSIMYMKRIIGLPGETISFQRGKAFINGEPLDEPYLKYHSDWSMPPETLGPDEYYFTGDNRSMPRSLHTQGRAHRSRIVGKVILWRNLPAFSLLSD